MDNRDRQMLEKIDKRTEKIMEKTGEIRIEQATQTNQIKTLFSNGEKTDKDLYDHEIDNKKDFSKLRAWLIKLAISVATLSAGGGAWWQWGK